MCLGGMVLPKIWRCALPNGHHIVTVYADEVDPHRTRQYTDLAMGVLGLTSCKDLCSD